MEKSTSRGARDDSGRNGGKAASRPGRDICRRPYKEELSSDRIAGRGTLFRVRGLASDTYREMENQFRSAEPSLSPEHGGGAGVRPPVAGREPVEHVIYGDRRVDDYAWLREKSDPRVAAYLNEENAYTETYLKSTEGFQEKLYQEMLSRIQQTDLSVPYRLRGYAYYTRTEEGKQYPIYCRKEERTPQGLKPVSMDAAMSEPFEAQDKLKLRPPKEEERAYTEGAESTEFTEGRTPGTRRREGLGGVESKPAPLHTKGAAPEESAGENAAFDSMEGLGGMESKPAPLHTKGAAPEESAGENAAFASMEGLGGMESKPAPLTPKGAAPEESAAGEEVLLDLNELAVGHTFMGLGLLEVSDDNHLLAYATDSTGFRQYTLRVKDLKKGELLRLRAERVTSAAWTSNNRTLFYVTEDEVTKRSNQLWRHVLGMELTDELVYEEKDERFRIDIERSRSGAYLFLVVNSHTTSEVRVLRADTPFGTFQLVAEREDNHEYYLDHHPGSAKDPAGGVFFIRTNSGGRTYRLVTAPTDDPRRERWHEVIANRPGVMLAGGAAFRTHLVLYEREDGLPYLRIVDLTRPAATALEASERIQFAEPAYNAMLGANPEFDTHYVRFHYESFVTPRSVYDYDVRTGERILRKQQPVLGGFDAAKYVSERLHSTAKDGTQIPLSLVYARETPKNGSAPLLLYAYGSYGLSMPVAFSSNRLSLLDRGMIYVIAHIRGGGELGKPWHDAGRMHQKMNTFTDFIASAEYLIAERFTAAERLVIEGGSAGGLLMGAVANMRPELFRAVVSHVPFVDVLNTMLDASLPLTVGEYEEWGNPQKEEDYFYIRQYCPYTNLEKKEYPPMLVRAGLNDSQVMYWEPAKYVAKLRTLKTDGNALLLKMNMGAGHGGASGRYDYLREIALDYAFMLGELGIGE